MFIVDIETLSTADNAKIIQIGALKYDTDHEIIDTFNMFPDEDEKQNHIDQRTLDRWNDPSRKEMFDSILAEEKEGLFEVLSMFREFIGDEGVVRANSPSFDLRILNHAFRQFGIKEIEFWRHMDIRTIKPYTKVAIINNHDGLQDCMNQLRIVMQFEDSIRYRNIDGLKMPRKDKPKEV